MSSGQRNRNISFEEPKNTDPNQARLLEYFQNTTTKCKKFSKSSNDFIYLSIELKQLDYFGMIDYLNVEPNKQLKGQVALEDIEYISFPESEQSKKMGKKCICLNFGIDKMKSFKQISTTQNKQLIIQNGVEILSKKQSQEGKKSVGHAMWAFKFEEGHNFYQMKSVLQNNNNTQVHKNIQNQTFSQIPQNSIHRGQENNKDRNQTGVNHKDHQRQQSLNLIEEDNDDQNKNDTEQNQEEDNQRSDSNGKNIFSDCIGDKQSWDTMYNKLLDRYYQKAKSNKSLTTSEEIEMAIHLFTLMGQQRFNNLTTINLRQIYYQRFREVAVASVRELVKELIFPERKRKYFEVHKEHPMYQFKIQGEKLYDVNGIFIRLAYIQIKYDERGNVIDYDDVNTKNLCNEFKANNYLTNTIHNLILQKKNNFKLRIPLTCIVDFLGFKCLCYGLPKVKMPKKQYNNKGYSKFQKSPLDANKFTLRQGFNNEEKYISQASVDEDMKELSERLKLKKLTIEEDKKTFDLYLSYFCEVHTFQQIDEKEKELDPSEKKFYLFRTSTVIPLHIDKDSHRKVNIFKDRLREEYACKLDKTISNGAFINQLNAKNEQEDTRVAEASQILITQVLRQMLDDLESLKLIAIGPESIKRIFHNYGVNMKHLGKVAKLTQLPHIKDVCVAEMVARSSKKILRANIAQYMFKKFRIGENFDEDEESTLADFYQLINNDPTSDNNNGQIFSKLLDIAQKKHYKKNTFQFILKIKDEQNMDKRSEYEKQISSQYLWILDEDNPITKTAEQIQKYPDDYIRRIQEPKKEMVEKMFLVYKIKEILWDFLNLVFSNERDTQTFWNDILRPQINKDFGYDISSRFPIGISHGFLIHSIKYHWRINFHVFNDQCLFSNQPFGPNPMKMIICANSKIYDMKNLKYHKIVNQYRNFINNKDYNSALNFLKLQELIIETKKDFEYTPPHAHELSQILADQAQIYLKIINTNSLWKNINMFHEYLNEAKNCIKKSINYIPLQHAEIIKLFGIQYKINQFKNDQNEEKKGIELIGVENFIEKILEYHLGKGHPLQSFLLCFLANQSLKKIRKEQEENKKIAIGLKNGIQQVTMEELMNELQTIQYKKQKQDDRREQKLRSRIQDLKNKLSDCADRFLSAIENSKVALEYKLFRFNYIIQKGNFHNKIAEFYQDLSIVYKEMHELIQSLEYLEKAQSIIIFSEQNNHNRLANLFYQMAFTEIQLGKLSIFYLLFQFIYNILKVIMKKHLNMLQWQETDFKKMNHIISKSVFILNSQYVLLQKIMIQQSIIISRNQSIVLKISGYVSEKTTKLKNILIQNNKHLSTLFVLRYPHTLYSNYVVIEQEVKLIDPDIKKLFFLIVIDENEKYHDEVEQSNEKNNKVILFFMN